MIAHQSVFFNRIALSAFRGAFKCVRNRVFYSTIRPLHCNSTYSHFKSRSPVESNLPQRLYFSSDATEAKKDADGENVEELDAQIDPEEKTAEDDSVDLTEKVTELEGKLAELTNTLKELQLKYRISLDNCEQIERISANKLQNAKLYAITQFAKDMLDVADAFELAFKALGTQHNVDLDSKFIEGIKMTESQLHKTFEKYGIKRFESLNQMFNPEVHEAMYEIQDDSVEKNTILQVVFNGYTIKDRILRAAKVGVSRK
uniref:GrpE protein homolog n=1 Tax=Babesia bovis TaxID=5865 RepID=S6B680_BABBO|nr:co-chaperone GrpE, putative [Babesia bovis]